MRVQSSINFQKKFAQHQSASCQPDPINNLVDLLLWFREHAIAVTADVEPMIMQIAMIEKH